MVEIGALKDGLSVFFVDTDIFMHHTAHRQIFGAQQDVFGQVVVEIVEIFIIQTEILEPFKGTFAEGKEYGVEVDMSVEEAYELSETDLKITVNGKSVSGTIGDNSISVFSSVKAVSDKKDSTPDSASTADSATSDSATTDGANNANGSIPTNEGNGTFVLFGVVIGIVAVAGVAYFIYIKKNK